MYYNRPDVPPKVSLKKRNKSIIFYLDFDQHYPVWPRVIDEYTGNYSNSDDLTLILMIPQDDEFHAKVYSINQIMSKKPDDPDLQ